MRESNFIGLTFCNLNIGTGKFDFKIDVKI